MKQVSGNCYLSEQENDMSDEIKQIYRIWQNRYNMMVLADEYEFSWIGKANPTKDQVFTYPGTGHRRGMSH